MTFGLKKVPIFAKAVYVMNEKLDLWPLAVG